MTIPAPSTSSTGTKPVGTAHIIAAASVGNALEWYDIVAGVPDDMVELAVEIHLVIVVGTDIAKAGPARSKDSRSASPTPTTSSPRSTAAAAASPPTSDSPLYRRDGLKTICPFHPDGSEHPSSENERDFEGGERLFPRELDPGTGPCRRSPAAAVRLDGFAGVPASCAALWKVDISDASISLTTARLAR